MDQYGGDYNRRPTMRYGGEYQQWGGTPRYDREFGYGGDRTGRFYDRDFSGYETRTFSPYRPQQRYDRGFMDRGRGFGQGQQFGNTQQYGQQYGQRYGQRYGQQYGQQYGQRYGQQYNNQQSRDPSYWYGMRDARPYPSPWDESHPGQNFGFGLGFGQGRGQFIYK
jgi:hypothetical protein